MSGPFVEKPDEFDQQLADSYVGKYVLAQLSIFESTGEQCDCIHLHGIIEVALPSGISVRLKGSREGEVYFLAPNLGAFEPEGAGFYELNNGDTVESPDLLAYFKITKAPKE